MHLYIVFRGEAKLPLRTFYSTTTMQDRIRQIMDHYGLSQQNFASQLGVAPATISSIFTGRTNPTNKHVQAIHKAFPEIDTNWLMFGEGEMMISLDSTSAEKGIGGEGNPLSVGESSESSLFGEELSGANPSTAIGGTVQNTGAMAGNARGLRREGGVLSQQYAGILETANLMDKKPRKIKEIRVFYDDGTFEVFSPSSK